MIKPLEKRNIFRVQTYLNQGDFESWEKKCHKEKKKQASLLRNLIKKYIHEVQ